MIAVAVSVPTITARSSKTVKQCKAGEYTGVVQVMLEANSGPQFGWLEAVTGAPMVAAMADLLMRGNA